MNVFSFFNVGVAPPRNNGRNIQLIQTDKKQQFIHYGAFLASLHIHKDPIQGARASEAVDKQQPVDIVELASRYTQREVQERPLHIPQQGESQFHHLHAFSYSFASLCKKCT
jgi:hypothetical protein